MFAHMRVVTTPTGMQTLRGNIRVLCRVRPCREGQTNAIELCPDHPGSLTVSQVDKGRSTLFEFNDVCGPTWSQEDVFEVRTCVSLLESDADALSQGT